MANDSPRPDPDQLLEHLQQEEIRSRRGKLKIFFGAAPGVGKTYAMLQAARQLRDQGVDVVVGLVETHSRQETAALLEGFEQLPLREELYRDRVVREFDLNGAIARRPVLILVDELAHSNVPGSRHPKRWQDIEELLDTGIDVLTTINVQHLESLNDVVGGLTGIRVWETVTDRIFDQADEVVLVDLPPDELLQRLKEGKVYLPEQAERAIENFFRKGNLIALRELALRRTADRVDDQRERYHHLAGSPLRFTRDTLLACVGPEPGEEALVRAVSRLANKLDSAWHALYVETPVLQRLPAARRQAILDTLKLAQDLGAQTATQAADDIATAIVAYARGHHLGQIVVSRDRPKRWYECRCALTSQLARLAPDLSLLELARNNIPQRTCGKTERIENLDRMSVLPETVRPYTATLLVCLATALATTLLLPYFDLANIIMLFLLAVVGVAVRYGRGAAVFAAIVNVVAFDVFFVPPRFSLAVHDWQYLMTFAVMLSVGLIVGQLTARFHYQARVAGAREQRARHLYEMARALSGALTVDQVIEISERSTEASFRVKARLLLPDKHDRLQPPLQPGKLKVDAAIAQWSFDRNNPAGLGTDTLPAASVLYLPLKAPLRIRGVLAVAPEQRRWLLIPEQRRLLDTFAALIAIALERVHFVTVARDTLVEMEGERQRNSLLAALSHDLRTPLTGLIGLTEALALDLAAEASPHQQSLAEIREQAVRMALLADNLLDMAKLQTGGIRLRKDWQSLEEVIGSALRLLEQPLRLHPVRLTLDPKLPLLHCDGVLMERVMVNLLENATKYTPSGTVIGITATVEAQQLWVNVWDDGPGLPAGQEQALFAKFSRGHTESATSGVGLGLAICQAVVEAHDGCIRAANRPSSGASFLITLPLETPPPFETETTDTAPFSELLETHVNES